MPRTKTSKSKKARGKSNPLTIVGAKKPSSETRAHPCLEEDCPWSFHTTTDLRRHSVKHIPLEQRREYMWKCPWPGCGCMMLQSGNMTTHYRTHTREKPLFCPDPDCRFATGDPASLTHHRQSVHDYIPGTDARKRPTTFSSSAAPSSSASSSSAANSYSPPLSQSSSSYSSASTSTSTSSSRSSTPSSAYSELSMQSWVSTSSLSSYSYGGGSAYPPSGSGSGYGGGMYAHGHATYATGPGADSMALAAASTWIALPAPAFDTSSCSMGMLRMDVPYAQPMCMLMPPATHAHAYTHAHTLAPTGRPGPALLYPATQVEFLQALARCSSEAEFTTLLDTLAQVQELAVAAPQVAMEAAPQVEPVARGFSFTL
ncbi:hypothetical protein C8R46DRAFT_1099548 [Mycena filopes]|nr:hypothetical protein C8R46DRAFT_1099548 [Mycena filopes]